MRRKKDDDLERGDDALVIAAEFGHVACVQEFVNAPGFDAGERWLDALESACVNGYDSCVRIILKRSECDVNKQKGGFEDEFRTDVDCLVQEFRHRVHFVIQTNGVMSQFQHYSRVIDSMVIDLDMDMTSTWLVFFDDDDLFAKERTRAYSELAEAASSEGYAVAFPSGKLTQPCWIDRELLRLLLEREKPNYYTREAAVQTDTQ